ncbi:MAG TPA: DUF4421 family protein [Polyangiaceae bacterium]|nr:DUF4421 family protein [Polyangiaceae bacterium]
MHTLVASRLRRACRRAIRVHGLGVTCVGVTCCSAWLAVGARLAHAEDATRPATSAKPAHGVESQTEKGGASEPDARDPVLVRPFLQIMYASFDFETEDDVALEIVPNPTSNLGVTLGAWGFGLSLSMDVGRVESSDEYGESDNFNVEFTYPFRVFGGRELDVAAFLHYHDTLSMSRAGAAREVVDGAVITTLGLDFMFVFDPKFSIADAFSDFSPRSGSRGSFFMRSSLELWFLGFIDEPERRLIPDALNEGFGDFVDLNGFNTGNATLGAGYAYDWNFARHFFLSMMGHLGLAGSLLELTFAPNDEEERSRALGASFGLQLAGSFVSKDFHAGLVTGAVADVINTHRVDVVSQRLSSTLFAGVRF